MFLPKKLQERLNKKLRALEEARPLSPAMVKKLREQFELEMVYNTNAIEGNKLTLKETFLVLHEGITIKGKSLHDHLEAKDQKEALKYLYDCIEYGKKFTFSESTIRNLQRLVVSKTESEHAGAYRAIDVYISGATHVPPAGHEVSAQMHQLMTWLAGEGKHIHAIERAALFHHKFVHVHPFEDGNGRTARLVMNLLLMREGYPLVVVLKNDRKKYYRALESADEGNVRPFVEFIAQAVERSLDMYLGAVTPSTKETTMLSLSKLAPHTPYSAGYLALLVRQGKLAAHKRGRNWVASLSAVRAYREGRERKRGT